MDMDLLLQKSGGLFELLAKDYELLHKVSICGVLSFYDWKYAEFFIDQDQYVIRSDGQAKWLLEQRGICIAFCKRYASGPKLEFAIEFDDQVWRYVAGI